MVGAVTGGHQIIPAVVVEAAVAVQEALVRLLIRAVSRLPTKRVYRVVQEVEGATVITMPEMVVVAVLVFTSAIMPIYSTVAQSLVVTLA